MEVLVSKKEFNSLALIPNRGNVKEKKISRKQPFYVLVLDGSFKTKNPKT